MGFVNPVLATYDGASWSVVPAPTMMSAITCSASSLCVAVGSDGAQGVVDLFNGVTWTTTTLSSVQSLSDVACFGTTECVAVGSTTSGAAAGSTFDGSGWSTTAVVAKATLDRAACVSASTCIAIGSKYGAVASRGLFAVLNGTAWTTKVDATAGGVGSNIACSGTTCVADAVGAVATFNGASWSVVASSLSRFRLSCASATACAAVADDGGLMTDSAGVWAVNKLPKELNFGALACASPTNCAAVGSVYNGISESGRVASLTGTAWTTSSSSADALTAIACPSATMCVAVGSGSSGGVASVLDGSGWHASTVAGTSALVAISCVSTANCVAVGWNAGLNGVVAKYDGATWNVNTVPGAGQFNAVTCLSTTFCVAGGTPLDFTSPAVVAVYDGTTWHVSNASSNGSAGVNAIACASVTKCLAVGDFFATAWNGTTWSDATPASPGRFGDVACPTTTTCHAVSDHRVWTLTGTTWTSKTAAGLFYVVTCATSAACFAAGSATSSSSGLLATFTGTTWSTTTVRGVGAIDAMRCPTTTQCVMSSGGSSYSNLVVRTTS